MYVNRFCRRCVTLFSFGVLVPTLCVDEKERERVRERKRGAKKEPGHSRRLVSIQKLWGALYILYSPSGRTDSIEAEGEIFNWCGVGYHCNGGWFVVDI